MGRAMELRKLRHFLAVLEAGSLGDAAKRLNISQPALSKSIQSLEQTIGGPLFVRSARGMIPTAVARAIELRVRIISAEVDRVQIEIREIREAGRGQIAIGAGPSFAQAVLPRAIGRLLQSSPNVEVVVIDGFIDSLIPAVRSGEIEFALLTLTSQIHEANIDTEVLVPRDRTVVVAGPQNPMASRRSVSIKDIWPGPWVLAREPDQLRRRLTDLFARADLPAPRAAVEFSSISFALGALRESNLVSFLPEILVRPDINKGALRAVQIPQLTWERSLGAVFRRGSSLTPAAKKLLAEIRRICHQQTGLARVS
jgi:DNA-binding transcriptional LysR family regulator